MFMDASLPQYLHRFYFKSITTINNSCSSNGSLVAKGVNNTTLSDANMRFHSNKTAMNASLSG